MVITIPKDLENHFVFIFGFNADGVHAMLTAQIARVQPVALGVLVLAHVGAEEVPVTVGFPLLGP